MFLQLFLHKAESLKLQNMTKSNSSSLYKELSYWGIFFFFSKALQMLDVVSFFQKKKDDCRRCTDSLLIIWSSRIGIPQAVPIRLKFLLCYPFIPLLLVQRIMAETLLLYSIQVLQNQG